MNEIEARLLDKIRQMERRLEALEVIGSPVVLLKTPRTNDAWSGKAKSSNDNGILDLSALFNVPAGVSGVLLSLNVHNTASGSVQDNMLIRPTSATASANPINLMLTSEGFQSNGMAWCPCDANGDVYFSTSVSPGDSNSVWLYVWGWCK
jgi:hypothetical protein